MFQFLGTSSAKEAQINLTGSKRRHSFDDSLTTWSKRLKTVDLVQDTNFPNLGASKSPGDSSQSEDQHDNITESPTSASCAEDASFISNTSLTTLSRCCSSSNPTHDVSRTRFHVKDLATFATTLEEAVKGAFPNRGRSRYAKINVCLIRWAEDQSVLPELERLCGVFEQGYGFKVESWTIPTVHSHRKLMGKALDFIEEFDTKGNLFVVYYAGHGTINENRQSVWCCTRDPKYASVDWSSIQSLFDDAISDVLILLDCCAAASSINTSGNGVNETIAACGFEGIAPPPGPHSFTNTLIEVLEDWKAKVQFSVSLLHSEVLFQLKRKRPEKGREGTRIPGWCSTPVHYVSSSDPRPQSIELSRLQASHEDRILESPPHSPRPFDPILPHSKLQNEQATVLTNVSSSQGLTVPHVLISVALEEEQADLNIESCRLWLAGFPALIKYVKVEGVFRSYSTLLLLALPVVIWNMLPENKAYRFVSFIVSENLVCTTSTTEETIPQQAVSEPSPAKKSMQTSVSDPLLRWDSSNYSPWMPRFISDETNRTLKSTSSLHATQPAVPFLPLQDKPSEFCYGAPPSDSGYGPTEPDQDHYKSIASAADLRPTQEYPPSWHLSSSSSGLQEILDADNNQSRRITFAPTTAAGNVTNKSTNLTPMRTDPGNEGFHELSQLIRTIFDSKDPVPIAKNDHLQAQDDAPCLEDAEKKALAILKLFRESGYSVQKDPSHLLSVKPGSAASDNNKDVTMCHICKKFRGRPCDLKRHMKRHSRPYGCTFSPCRKRFGSKNDWKRHENSQHFHPEIWRCCLPHPSFSLNNSLPSSSPPIAETEECAKVCYRRVSFLEHIMASHADFSKTVDEKEINRKVDEYKIGRNCQIRFWCGFCKKLIDLKSKGLDAWNERFDHIDDHFMGRRGKINRIEGWLPVDNLEQKIPEEKREDSFSESGTESDSDTENGTSLDFINIKPEAPRATPVVYCCKCQRMHDLRFNATCSNCGHSHIFCSTCIRKIEYHTEI